MTFLATEEEQIAYLDVLAGQVATHGWTAYVRTPPGRLPYLSVQDPRNLNTGGDIVAASDAATGECWFWFAWAERIAPAENPAKAAHVIVRALRQPTAAGAVAVSVPSQPGSSASRQPGQAIPSPGTPPRAEEEQT
jgi:hypothetical protein